MHPHLITVLARLDDSRAVLQTAVDAVPMHLRQQRPAPDRWSVTQVVEHLALADRRFASLLVERITEARSGGLAKETHPLEPIPAAIATLITDRSHRRTALEPVQPGDATAFETAWAAAEAARDDFRAMIVSHDGFALSQVLQHHPVFGALNVYQWVELVALHEGRHTEQIREIAAQFSTAGA